MAGRAPARRLALGAVGLTVLAVAVPWSLTHHQGGGTGRDSGAAVAGEHPHAQESEPATPVRVARRVGAVAPEAPLALRLPSGTSVDVVAVSSRPDGELDVPDDVRKAGWWRGGSRIGDPFGSTLIAGHVDSASQGLGRFAELLSVHRGQVVTVLTPTLRQDFRVTSRRVVVRGLLAHNRWIYAPDGPPRLTLVTCAPPYVRQDGGYQNLAVVVARPARAPSPRKSR